MVGRILAIFAIATTATAIAQQTPPASTPRDLFERARMLDESNQELPDAIALYEQAAAEAAKASQRELAATAHLRIGLIHERLGRKAEAERAFMIVVTQYAEQTEIARQAQRKLTAASDPSTGVSATRLVWAGPGADVLGAPSPDGKWLSFVDWDTGDLAVRELASGRARRLTNKGTWQESGELAEWSTFSPDSLQLVYAWQNSASEYELRVISLADRTPRVLARHDEARFMQPHQWAPDGASILVRIALKSGVNQLALVAVADGSITVLKTVDWSWPSKMGFSPDGRFVAYDLPPQPGVRRRDIFVLARDGSRETRLVDHPADDTFLGWAPDGRHVMFASDRTGTSGVWGVPVTDGRASGAPSLLKRDVGRIWPLGFTAAGAYYYGFETGMIDIFVIDLDNATGRATGAPVQLTDRFVGANTWPAFSPDGQSLAFVSKRSPGPPAFQQILSILSMPAKDQRDLTTDLSYIGRVRWSADGRSLLVNARDGRNRQGIFRVDARTGATEAAVVTDPGSYALAPRWSTDGNALVYVHLDPAAGVVRVMQRTLGTGAETELYRTTELPPIQRLALAPGGDRIAFISTDRGAQMTSLNVVSTRTGEIRRLVTARFPEDINYGYDMLEWSPDGRFIYALKKPGGAGAPQEIWRVAASGGHATAIGVSPRNPQGLAAHPDGVRLAYSAGQMKSEIWVMENFLPPAAEAAGRTGRR
jgi:Tol biopolymer transport system component